MLKEHNPVKYRNAVVADKPDIQDKISNVGVEVVTADFKDNVIMNELREKSFLQFLKMTDCHSIKAKEIKYLVQQNKNIFKIFLEELPFFEQDNQAIALQKIEKLFELKDNSNIYLTRHKKFNYDGDESEGIRLAIPPAQWTGKLPHIMLERYREKSRKLKTYKKFKEMNLYIHTLMANLDEIEEFRELLMEEIKIDNTNYSIVYVLNNWGIKKLIEIVLESDEE